MPGIIRDPRQNASSGRPTEHQFGILYLYDENKLLDEFGIPYPKEGCVYMAYDKIREDGTINSFRRELMPNDRVEVSGPIIPLPEGVSFDFEGVSVTHIIELPEDEYHIQPDRASMNKKMLINRILHGVLILEDQKPDFVG